MQQALVIKKSKAGEFFCSFLVIGGAVVIFSGCPSVCLSEILLIAIFHEGEVVCRIYVDFAS